MKRKIMKISCLMLIWFVFHILFITIDGLMDKKQLADVGVVLGNKVEKDGKPSERLRYRLEKAVELYRGGYFKSVIVSGGVGAEGYDEAKIMKQYLIQKGVPDDKILVDSMGANTMMTAQNVKTMMEDMQFKSVMVITQFYHISRTKLAFHKAGVEEVYSAHADYFEWRDGYSLFREFFAYYKYLFFKFS